MTNRLARTWATKASMLVIAVVVGVGVYHTFDTTTPYTRVTATGISVLVGATVFAILNFTSERRRRGATGRQVDSLGRDTSNVFYLPDKAKEKIDQLVEEGRLIRHLGNDIEPVSYEDLDGRYLFNGLDVLYGKPVVSRVLQRY